MRIRKVSVRFLLIVAVVFWAGPAVLGQSVNSSPPEVLTLDNAVEFALDNNRQVKNASLEVSKAGERLLAARSLWLPTFKLSAMGLEQVRPIDFIFQQGIFGVYPNIGPVPATNTKIISPGRLSGIVNGRISQPLSDLYRTNLQMGGLRLDRDFVREELRVKQHEIIQEVKQTYLAILQTQSGLESSTEDVNRYRELERETDEYLAQELALKGDSLEVKLRLARAEGEVLSLTDQLATQKQRLNKLLGRDVLAEFSVSPLPEQPASDNGVVLTAARASALERRPELREARLRVKEAEQDRRIKKSEFIPDAKLTGQYFGAQNFNEIVPRNVLAVGITLDWDVFDWGRKKHELSEKDLTIEQSNNNLREAENSVLVEVDAMFRGLQQARQRLRIAELSREVAAEKVRVIAARYEVQASVLKDVLEEQTALEQANHLYQVALSALWIAKADLARATGEDK
jgi:outer membrane protein TolC